MTQASGEKMHKLGISVIALLAVIAAPAQGAVGTGRGAPRSSRGTPGHGHVRRDAGGRRVRTRTRLRRGPCRDALVRRSLDHPGRCACRPGGSGRAVARRRTEGGVRGGVPDPAEPLLRQVGLIGLRLDQEVTELLDSRAAVEAL